MLTTILVWPLNVMMKRILVVITLLFGSMPAMAEVAEAWPLPRDADIYLVPMGAIPHTVLGQLATYYREVASLRVEITAELPILDDSVDHARSQFIAEPVMMRLSRVFSAWLTNPNALVIGVSGYDMYIADTDWRFAFAAGQGKVAVVSGARMGDGASSPQIWSPQHVNRLGKMMSKRIAIQLFGVDSFTNEQMALFTSPILGLPDLDRMDEAEIRQTLASLAAQSGRHKRAPVMEGEWARLGDTPEGAESDDHDWLAVTGILGTIALGFGLLVWLLARHHRGIPDQWRLAARRLGWQLSGGDWSWFRSGPLELHGEIDGITLQVDWHQRGTGRNVHQATRFRVPLETLHALQVGPVSGWRKWFPPGDRLKSGDSAYDCRFVIESPDQRRGRIDLPPSLRRRHLRRPMTILLGEDGLSAEASGLTDDADDLNEQIQTVAEWLAFARNRPAPVPAPGSRESIAMAPIWPCWLGKLGELTLWGSLISTAMLFFWVRGEETNIPWLIAWDGLAPVFAVAWAGYIALFRAQLRRRFLTHILRVTALPSMVFGFVWLAAGIWVLAWNALGVEGKPVHITGPVIAKEISSGKGGPSYHVTVQDIGEHRPVELTTDTATYNRLRLGDPAVFTAYKGRLGIYYWSAW